jgi:hypothetical protein
VAAAGYSYAGVGERSTRALAALQAEHCPFAALRAAFRGSPASTADRAAKTEAALHTAFDDPWEPERSDARGATGTTHAATGQDCADGDCPWAAARTGYLASTTSADITRQVTPTADGVVIRISSRKPELVKQIHARFAPMFAKGAAASGRTAGEELARK